MRPATYEEDHSKAHGTQRRDGDRHEADQRKLFGREAPFQALHHEALVRERVMRNGRYHRQDGRYRPRRLVGNDATGLRHEALSQCIIHDDLANDRTATAKPTVLTEPKRCRHELDHNTRGRRITDLERARWIVGEQELVSVVESKPTVS